MRTPAINGVLLKTISEARLNTYLIETNDDLNAALTLYEFNTHVSEVFYTPLQCLEICLRNTVDQCMSNVYGPDWFKNGNAPLNSTAQLMVQQACNETNKTPPISAGDIIAELKFAFWVGLLGKDYDSTLWRRALYKGFQRGGGRKRSDVHGRFNMIRRFRNRVAHHEPIFQRDLLNVHDEILDAIGWMCADTRAWTSFHSRAIGVINLR